MNIQISVVLWTVICFLLLMLILKNLLFKPVFRVMDERKAKIENAAEKRREAERLTEEHEKRMEILREDAKIQRQNLLKSELELIRTKTKADTEKMRTDRLMHIEEYKALTVKEREKIIEEFDASSEEIVKAFADRLTL